MNDSQKRAVLQTAVACSRPEPAICLIQGPAGRSKFPLLYLYTFLLFKILLLWPKSIMVQRLLKGNWTIGQ